MKTESVKIGNKIFNSYKEYEKAYLERWDALHTRLSADLNWIKKDWEIRNSQINSKATT